MKLVCLVFFCAFLPAQPVHYGRSCNDELKIGIAQPHLGASTLGVVKVRDVNFITYRVGIWFGMFKLAVPVGIGGAQTCYLLTPPVGGIKIVTTGTTGWVGSVLDVPSVAALIGRKVHMQAATRDSWRIHWSDGVVATIQR